jgi:hypothetical protein
MRKYLVHLLSSRNRAGPISWFMPMGGVGAGVDLTHVLRNHLPCLILREPMSVLGLHP